MKFMKTFFLIATLLSLFTMNAKSQAPGKKYESALSINGCRNLIYLFVAIINNPILLII